MPHLITIIKYARKVVKYSLALLSALSAGHMGSYDGRHKWFVLIGLASKMASFGNFVTWWFPVGSGQADARGCPGPSYFEL